MTATMTAKRTTRRISGRRLSWSAPRLILTLSYTDGSEEATEYLVDEVGSDAGRSFNLTRWSKGCEHGATTTYRVSLAGDGQQACQCGGFAVRSTCKHTDALRKLIDTGRIAGGYPAAE